MLLALKVPVSASAGLATNCRPPRKTWQSFLLIKKREVYVYLGLHPKIWTQKYHWYTGDCGKAIYSPAP